MNQRINSLDATTTQELIDNYLLAKLDKESLAYFHNLLHCHPHLLTEVRDQQAVVRSIEEYYLLKLLDKFHHELPLDQNKNWQINGIVAIAVSIVILLGVSIWAIFHTEISAQQVFAENFEPDPGLATDLSTGSQIEFYDGMQEYKRKEYREAISKWEPLYAANPKNDTLIYFLGMANLANGNVRQAKHYLNLAAQNPDSEFYNDIQHYLALTYLKENKIKSAKEILSKSEAQKNKNLLKNIKVSKIH